MKVELVDTDGLTPEQLEYLSKVAEAAAAMGAALQDCPAVQVEGSPEAMRFDISLAAAVTVTANILLNHPNPVVAFQSFCGNLYGELFGLAARRPETPAGLSMARPGGSA